MDPIPFRSVLMTEGVLSRDGRMMAPGSQVWACPMTLYAQTSDGHGGEPGPTVIAGRIDTITRQGNDLIGEGFFTTDEGIYIVAPMVADLTLNGISVDTAPKVIEYRVGTPDGIAMDAPVQQTPEEAANPVPQVSEGEPVHRESVDDVIMVVIEGEIIAATICGKPAMAGAYIELVTEPDPAAPADLPANAPTAPVAAVAAGGRPIYRVTSRIAAPPPSAPADAPAADAPPQPDMTGGAMICLMPPEAAALAINGGTAPDELHVTLMYLGDAADLGPDALAEIQAICDEVASGVEPGTGTIAGPAAFVNDPDPDEPAQVPLVALVDSDWACDLYHALDDALDASGIDTPSEHGFLPHITLQYADAPTLLDIAKADLSFGSIFLVVGTDVTEYQCGAAMTASAIGAAPDEPPSAWFDDPRLAGPTPLTVADDGRVYGHIATWGTCHTGFAGRCVMAPKSRSGYAYFHLGELKSSDGERIPVGQITLDTRHADLAATRKQAELHYEHTGHAVADVRAGEDKWGIYVAGAIRPETPASALRKFRGAKISGDWRSVKGALELIGALAVNIPGFPVPRTQARVASATGDVTALIGGPADTTPLHTDAEMIDALAFMAEHGENTIGALVASINVPTPTIESIIASMEAA